MPKIHILYQLAMMGAMDVLPAMLREQKVATRLRGRLDRQAIAAASHIARRYNGALYQDTPDRLVLETAILPYYQLHDDFHRLVFVGCDWYTAGYPRLFAHKEFWTIEPDAARAGYGAPRHIVAPMRNIRHQLRPGCVDVIFCNGVIGWGLDDPAEAETSFAAAFDVLRPGGHLVIGFNDRAPHTPFHPDGLQALERFEPFVFEPLGTSEHRIPHELRHVYRFYRKPGI